LSLKFESIAGRGLTPENLHFLCEKAMRTLIPFPVPDDYTITCPSFCKEQLPGRGFTFWEWFYAAAKLTKEHLMGPWKDGAITGFISKKNAEDVLRNCAQGTFILRFSDSELGGISIAWTNFLGPVPQVLHIHPFNTNDLKMRTIADRMKDFNQLVELYPNKSKQDAFEKYRACAAPQLKKDYIRAEIVSVIPVAVFNSPCSRSVVAIGGR